MSNTLEEALEEYNNQFFKLCQARQQEGAESYGALGFLKNDMFQFIYEELADAANYLRFLFIKLRSMEEGLDASGINLSASTPGEVREADEIPLGPASFVGVQEVFGLLQGKKSER